jgi:hypothetical protein
MEPEIKRGPGRPRKLPVGEHPVIGPPTEIEVRMGPRPCMTSKGVSMPGKPLGHGIIVSLPRDEAENLLNLGYATRV